MVLPVAVAVPATLVVAFVTVVVMDLGTAVTTLTIPVQALVRPNHTISA